MRVNITANTCTIDNNVYLNAGEYNINKFYFTFSEEYLDEYVKKALFIDKDGTPIEMVIANNECDIPYDILKNPGTYTFGVYAYEMNGTELVLRYSPEPTHFYVNKGSYMEDGTSPTEPTPDEFAQYYQAMQDLIANAKPELIDYIEDNLPTIHVGETSTLTPGTPATVTNVGTERNPVFDFGIPQGVPGTTDYNELSNKPDLTVFALVTESANKIALEIDPTEFKIKAKILDKNNRLISESNVIDLPLESVVVSGEYDAANKKIILTLENGSVIDIPVEDLIDGLATKTELEEGLATKDANIIESISKNGAPLPVNANKNVNITVPTRTSEVINDSGFITNDTNGLSHYYNKTAADTRFSLVTETGSNFTLSIDPTTFVMTATLKDKNGRALSTQTVDLPLESVVVGGRYDSETREVVLTLENGSVVRFSVADLVSGLQSEITDSNKLSSDLVDDTNSVNKFVTATDKTNWDAKLDTDDLTDYVKNTDYATGGTAGVVKIAYSEGSDVSSTGYLRGIARTYADYPNLNNTYIISKGTLENVIEGKGLVSNTDYATENTGGVVRAGPISSGYEVSQTGATAGRLGARILTYTQYQNNLYTNGFVGKGTLENVITGKGLVSDTDYATTNKGGVIKPANYFQVAGDGTVYCAGLAYNVYQLVSGYTFISKGTLENVLNARIGDISSIIDAINGEVV